MADSLFKYIGSFPLQNDDTKTLLAEFEKFMKKLQAMQRQMINHVINTTARANKRHSLTTVEILSKLTEKGLNCLEGEPLEIQATRLAIQFCDPNSEDVTHIGIEDISIVQALEYGKNQGVTILAVLENQGTQYECHLIRADKEHNLVIEKTLREGMALWNQNSNAAEEPEKTRTLTPRKTNFRVSLRQSSRKVKKPPTPDGHADEVCLEDDEFGGFDDEMMDSAFGRLNDEDETEFGFGGEDMAGFGEDEGDYAVATMFDTTAPPAPPPRGSTSGNNSGNNSRPNSRPSSRPNSTPNSRPGTPTSVHRTPNTAGSNPTSNRSSLGSGADEAAPEPPRRRSHEMAPEPPARREPAAPEYLKPEPPPGSVQYSSPDYLEPERPLQKGPTYKVPNKMPKKPAAPKQTYAAAHAAPAQHRHSAGSAHAAPTAQQAFNGATGANAVAAVAAAVGANKTPTAKSSGHNRPFNNNMPFVVDMSKVAVEKLINDRSKGLGNGAFVIRNSESQAGEFTLSFQNSDMVTHMRIQKLEKKNGLHLFTLPAAAEAGGPWFKSLPSMVQHYQTNVIPGLGSTLVKLGKPVAGHSAGASGGQTHRRPRPAPAPVAPAQSAVEEFVTEDVQYDMAAQKARGGLSYHQHVPAGRGPGGGR